MVSIDQWSIGPDAAVRALSGPIAAGTAPPAAGKGGRWERPPLCDVLEVCDQRRFLRIGEPVDGGVDAVPVVDCL